MKTNTNYCFEGTRNGFENFAIRIKLFLTLFLILGFFVQKAASQAICYSMLTQTPKSSPKQLITFTVAENANALGKEFTLKIVPNNSGAFFVATGTNTLTSFVAEGVQNFIVNTGSNIGLNTVVLFYNEKLGGAGCSASFEVEKTKN